MLMLGGAVVLLEILILVVTLAGPPQEGRQRLSELAHTIAVSDAWSFLGVFAAFVVAIQVTAWGNQQAGDRLAHVRSSRFTVAAVLTGSLTTACWVLFTSAFNTEAPGQYLLLTSAAVGIVFFAADGASIVLRQDRRRILRFEARQAIRGTCAVLGREFLGMRYPRPLMMMALVAFIGWCALLSGGVLGVLAVMPVWGGEEVTFAMWANTYSVIASLLLLLVGSAVVSVACCLVWRSKQRLVSGQPRDLLPSFSWVIAAGVFALLAAAACIYLPVAAIVDGAPWWAASIIFLIVALPAAIPFTALIAPQRPSPRTHWWTPRGSVRVGFAAAARGYVHTHLTDVRELTILFDDADR
ncbi:hypothetical protein [Leifsonia naganoensis]|uniref:Uncharacterized protein n=1 Tax=Leifsonia naganoensis TaxID=150025 RepID=A0A853DKZ2_9MICO|nr:hypothetical protein [Leifsonia naganoensis]NYK09068.1 hypothetical protein [Leifsonia naganoensis]